MKPSATVKMASLGERFGATAVEVILGVAMFFASMVLWVVFGFFFGFGGPPREVTPVDEAYQDLQPVYSFFDFLGSGVDFINRAAVRASVTLPLIWLAWSVLAWRKSTSPTKGMMKMRIVGAKTGEPATMGQMAIRELGGKLLHPLVGIFALDWFLGTAGAYVYLGYFLVSAIVIVVGRSRQGIWDHLAGTRVVRVN